MVRWREVSERLSIVMFWVYRFVSHKVALCVPGMQQGARKRSPCSGSRLSKKEQLCLNRPPGMSDGSWDLLLNI